MCCQLTSFYCLLFYFERIQNIDLVSLTSDFERASHISWYRSGVFIVNMGQMPCIDLLSSISEFEDIVNYFLPTQLLGSMAFLYYSAH